MRWILIVLLALSCTSCGDDNPPPQNQGGMKPWSGDKNMRPSNPGLAPMKPRAQKPVASKDKTQNDSPVPPKDAQFTIYCEDFVGTSHVDLANHAKAQLISATPLRGWYIIHLEDHSTLFFGYYRAADDPAAQADRSKIQSMQTESGMRIFQKAMIVPVDAPDPVAPQEWNLANLRKGEDDTQHYWTIQIAAYKDSAERKQAAVETVRAAREQGVEAYFFHGDTVSSVCVGMWPREAVREDGLKQGAVEADDRNPDSEVIVTPGDSMPDAIRRQALRTGKSVVRPQFTIVDPQMLAMKQRFPTSSVNNVEAYVSPSGKVVRGASPSLIVHVPVVNRAPLSAIGGIAPAPVPGTPQSDALRAVMPDSPQGGSGTVQSR